MQEPKQLSANELRVGNLVDDSGIKTVAGVSEESVILKSEAGLYETPVFPYGIEITPEWLERFGFVKYQNYDHVLKTADGCYYSVNYREEYQDIPAGYYFSNDYGDAGCYILCCVQFVHQLQNIVFAITEGTELEIKQHERKD